MFLAIDIGGTNIQFALITNENEIKKHWEVKNPNLKEAKDFYDFIYQEASLQESIEGIGVSVPGVVEEDGLISSKAASTLHCLYLSNIIEELQARFNVKVTALNDAKAAALCELHLGAAKGSTSSISFIIGTGIGGAITYKDEVLFGKDGYAGEFSYIPILVDGKHTPLAVLASASGLAYQYRLKTKTEVKEAKEVFDRYYEKEEDAIEVMNQWLMYIGLALSQLTVIYNPDVICIGGGVTNDKNLLNQIKDAYQKYMTPMNEFANFTSEIVLCEYPTQSNLFGAMIYYKQKNGLI